MKPQRPYKRTDRVGEQILEIVTDTAAKHIDLNHLGFVTFTGIDVSPDLRSAIIYFSALNPTDEIQNIENKINTIAKGFKKYLGIEMRIKNIPDLRFIYDQSLNYTDKINQMIQTIVIPKQNDS
ncbi:MAG: 30S ribosome-binding factor RbfA [Candidatus Marinimicrobia bacterium]|nr:30S ribosome-binding factor RbfA [Candidatus Neomarinimicrobiota bacterium]HJM46957.1 30S ribosome-binding factor RbfA [Candidatus Neomarinimicrobiota bacterium]